MEDPVNVFVYENELFITFYSKVTVQLSNNHLENLRSAINGIEFPFILNDKCLIFNLL